jgi:hypothetical protein
MAQADAETTTTSTTTSAAVADDVIAQSLEPLLELGLPKDSKLTDKIRPLARELLIELSPQDAAERMLAVQMIASFSRSMFLSRNANLQKHPKWFSLYSAECSRAMTLFRRQVQTFTDLRRPRRTTFNAIRQANIANQQIVVNDQASTPAPQPLESQPSTNTLQPTTPNAQPLEAEKASPVLPPQRNRSGRPAGKRTKKPPLGT